MKVLVADQFDESGLDGLEAAGCEVIHDPTLEDEALGDGAGATTRRRRAGRPLHAGHGRDDGWRRLGAHRAGRGRLQHDRRRRRASARGIYVSNCPGKNAVAVAELAFGLILSLDRRMPDDVADAARRAVEQEGILARRAACRARTLALLGFGNIGQEVARRAQAFGHAPRRSGAAASRGAAADLGATASIRPHDSYGRGVARRRWRAGATSLSVHLALGAGHAWAGECRRCSAG